ncbi:MAG: hypothetical protein KA007_01805 [Candidatus Pacebacteria bacterium]|jgi:hypothetical protein|nr:hypothetical protein [Candidatus Paceibacterota bacterium]
MIGGYKLLLWIGILVIVLPFIGVPVFWKEIILFLVGIVLVAQSLFIHHQEKMFLDTKDEEVFVENNLQN